MLNTIGKAARFSTLVTLARPILFIISTGVIIVICVHFLLGATVDRAIQWDGERKAVRWAELFNNRMDGIDEMMRTKNPTPRQLEQIELAIAFADVFHVRVFDPAGNIIVSSNTDAHTEDHMSVQSNLAMSVFITQMSHVQVHKDVDDPHFPHTYAEAHVLALNKAGEPAGVIEVFVDESHTADYLTSAFQVIGYGVPLVSALLYLLPSLAFLIKSKEAQARTRSVQKLSRFDTLTGVLNRNALTTETEALFAGRSDPDSAIGVFFIDVDKFKLINDIHGHEFGDNYLRHVAQILMTSTRDADLVGRMGGDEFLVILPGLAEGEIDSLCDRILSAIREPFQYKGTSVTGSISIGSHLSVPNETKEEAWHGADLALYHAKASGRNQAARYHAFLDEERQRRRLVERTIDQALRDGSFKVVFQPLVCPKTERIVGFESLIRLQTRDGDFISPDEFIPIAEESGTIHDIGMFVLRRAVEAARTWPEDIFVSVNLSTAQFVTGDLVDRITQQLERMEFPATRLELEVTESLLMENEDEVAAQLIGLKDLGISIAMDDFGTGYSSLGYLWKFNFDKLKVDRSFLEGYKFDAERYRDIIEMITVLGHKMGMTVTVEGVEDQEQLDMLSQINCDQYQGYFFGRPMDYAQTHRAIADANGERRARQRSA